MSSTIPDWDEFQEELEFLNGSLIDIVAVNADADTWPAALDLLFKESDIWILSRGGEILAVAPPRNYTEVEILKLNSTITGKFFFGAIQLNCHFFSTDDLELDADPRQIATEDAYHKLVDICGSLARRIGREIRICAEGIHESPIATLKP